MSKGGKDKTGNTRQPTDSAAGASLAAEATREAARLQREATLGAAEITRGGVITVAKLSLLGVCVTSSLVCLGVVAQPVVADYLKRPQSVVEPVTRPGPAPMVVHFIVPESGIDPPKMMELAALFAAEILRVCGPAGCGPDSELRPTVILEFRAK